MTLREYKRKRDFKTTPEPSGAGAKNAPGRLFVIQKHAASRLHYDFRLELDGTLKSWAVPKGPSLDPKVKSLAVRVEDHPIDYATFEGVIPQGEYGGGTVMVWDHGTWEPEVDPQKGLKAGKLKFTLHGEKLHGSWALVQMHGKSGDDGKNWLLIKHRDAAAKSGPRSDILKREPLSIVSGRDLDEIAADADRVWSSNRNASNGSPKGGARSVGKRKKSRDASAKQTNGVHGDASKVRPISTRQLAAVPGAKKATQPHVFKPQLATLASRVPSGDGWLYELKFDGYRVVSLLERGKARLMSRNGNDWTHRFRIVAEALESLPIKNAILDGEVVSLDDRGISNFQQLQNLLKQGNSDSLVYYIFDAPHFEGYDLTQTPLSERKQVLARVMLSANPENSGTLRYSDHILGSGESVLQHACRSAMEGVIAKRADSAYVQSRSSAWLKIKCLQQQEFVIGGYTKPEGSRVGFGALLLGYYDNGELMYAGRVGTGFTKQSLRQLVAELKKRMRKTPVFKNPPTGAERRGVTWVAPELVAEVEFTEWTSDGRLRHPSFHGLREDKAAEDVMRERPQATASLERAARKNKPSASRRTASNSRPGRAENDESAVVGGVRLTNPDRVLYQEPGFTKRDLAEYYTSVADWILPYVVERPLTLVRCPEGQAGECFYQKHLTGSMPDAVAGVMVQEKGKREEYVMIRDLVGLISLVQMGVLEMHPWPAKSDKLERPDYLVFDLDPGEGAPWKAVVQGAKDVRARLENAGLASFLRTSGGKGLHVVVPIVRRSSWDEVKDFAKAVADAMARDDPDHYIATMSKAKRQGKVYVDYLRNQRGATAIASYSTRARAGAPVATPLAWDELGRIKAANTYNIESLPKRLAKLKSDPWADFFSTQQSLTRKIRKAFD